MPDSSMKQFSSALTGKAYEYLKSNMPQGKFWRRKSQQGKTSLSLSFKVLTLFQTTHFKLFQNETVCRRQF